MTDATTPYADSEVSRLRTVLLHRPGLELSRLTPRNNDELLFDGIPWVGRAQHEHDMFAGQLRDHGVEVLYLAELLTDVLEQPDARRQTVAAAVDDPRLGVTLAEVCGAYLHDLGAADLALALMGGVRHDELPGARGLSHALMGAQDFILPPLPNLLFTRDSSVWLRDQVAVTSLTMPARNRETSLTRAIYSHHPRFATSTAVYGPGFEHLEGGDVLLLAPGVVAVGVGERTTPAGAERLARRLFHRRLAHTVLVVPIAQERAMMHLDTICTMVDVDSVVMYPNVAGQLMAWTLTEPDDLTAEAADDEGELVITGPEPLLVAAAKAMQIDRLHVIDTGLDPVTAEREQWDDGNNTLAIAPRLAVAYERNVVTNARLEDAGIEVLRISGSELGSGRGGPRCMSCPVVRDPL